MSNLKFFLLFLLLPLCFSLTYINDCSVLNTEGETYILSSNLSGNLSSKICLRLNASNIVLDCNGHSIVGNAPSTTGIVINKDNIIVKNCIVKNYSKNIEVVGDKSLINNSSILDFRQYGILTLISRSMQVINSNFNSYGKQRTGEGDTIALYLSSVACLQNSTFENISISNTTIGIFLSVAGGYDASINNNSFYNISILNTSSALSVYSVHDNVFEDFNIFDTDFGVNLSNSFNNSFTDFNISSHNYAINSKIGNSNNYSDISIFDSFGYLFVNDTSDYSDFYNLSLCYNKSIGCVFWDYLNLSKVNVNNSVLILNPEFISLNVIDNISDQLNKSATISLDTYMCSEAKVYKKTGFPQSKSDIIVNGSEYPTTKFCEGDTIRFNVSSFSGYAASINYITQCRNITDSGYYILLNNLTSSPTTVYCLKITGDNITLNLNNYSINNASIQDGIDIYSANNVSIFGGSIYSKYNGIFAASSAYNIHIYDLTVSVAQNSSNAYAIYASSYNLSIDNITVPTSNQGLGVYFTGNSNKHHRLSNSRIYSQHHVVDIRTLGTIVENCNFSSNYTSSSLISLCGSNSNNSIIRGNRFENCNYGISSRNVKNVSIYNNYFSCNISNLFFNYAAVYEDGKLIPLVPYNFSIYNNTLTNALYSLRLEGSKGNFSIYNNTFYNNEIGLEFLSYSNDSQVYNNIFYDNSNASILLNSVFNNTFYNNIFNDTLPVKIPASGTNFFNITKNCSIPNILGGQCIGGNYYKNYSGSDSNGDGIGEQVYVINENNTDYLPLTNNISQTQGLWVNIQNPKNESYTLSVIDVNFTKSSSAESCYYYLNGTGPTQIPNCDNFSLALSKGSYNLTIYVNNSSGETNSSSVFFSILTNFAGDSCYVIDTPGEYYLTSNVSGNLSSGICFSILTSNVVFDCNMKHIVGNSQNTYAFFVVGDNITIKNCNILNYSYGFLVENSSKINISSNDLYNFSGSYGSYFLNVSNSSIFNNLFSNTHDGVYLENSSLIYISYNNFVNISNSSNSIGEAIGLENNVENINIFLNNISCYNLSFYAINLDNTSSPESETRNLFIYNNNFENCYVYLDNGSLFNIANISLSGRFYLHNIHDSNLSHISISNSDFGLGINDSFDNSFSDINITNSSLSLFITGNSGNSFSNIGIYNSTTYLYMDALHGSNFNYLSVGRFIDKGLITWKKLEDISIVNLTEGSNIILNESFVSLNTSSVFTHCFSSVSAEIKIETENCSWNVYRKSGFPLTRSDIYLHGFIHLPIPRCSSNIASFKVSEFSGYTTYYDDTAPGITIEQPEPKIYNSSQLSLNYTVYANDTDSCWYYLNDSRYSIDNCSNISLTLDSGKYNLKVYVNDTSGNVNYSSLNFSVDTVPPYYNLKSTGAIFPPDFCSTHKCVFLTNTSLPEPYIAQYDPEVYYFVSIDWTDGYPYSKLDLLFLEHNFTSSLKNESINASGTDSSGILKVYRLGVGNYSYRSWANDSVGNVNDSMPFRGVRITKAQPNLSLVISPNSVEFGHNVNVTCSGPLQLNLSLYRNGSLVATGFGIVKDNSSSLAIGNYSYICNTTGNQNYTNVSTNPDTLQIIKATPNISLKLNEHSGDISIYKGADLFINGSVLLPNKGHVELYIDGAFINSGNGSVQHTTSWNTTGQHNITLLFNATENYTNKSISYVVYVRSKRVSSKSDMSLDYEFICSNNTLKIVSKDGGKDIHAWITLSGYGTKRSPAEFYIEKTGVYKVYSEKLGYNDVVMDIKIDELCKVEEHDISHESDTLLNNSTNYTNTTNYSKEFSKEFGDNKTNHSTKEEHVVNLSDKLNTKSFFIDIHENDSKVIIEVFDEEHNKVDLPLKIRFGNQTFDIFVKQGKAVFEPNNTGTYYLVLSKDYLYKGDKSFKFEKKQYSSEQQVSNLNPVVFLLLGLGIVGIVGIAYLFFTNK